MRKISYLFAILLLFSGCTDDRDEAKRTVDPSYTYFLVAEKTNVHGDSYILPLKTQQDIAQARAMIADPSLQQIVVAQISKEDNGHPNTDLKRKVTYSWSVDEFIGFADFTIEIYDGWPIYVEENYNEWVSITKGDNGKGRIGFWNYSIVREVPLSELE